MSERNISRHETGLQVRIERGGEAYTKWFAKGTYRTWKATFKAAREYRDALLEELGPPDLPEQRSRGRIWSDGERWHGWVRAANGRPAATSRSIGEHGTRAAKRLVRSWLTAHLQERDTADAVHG